MRDPAFKEKLTEHAAKVIALLEANGERYGDDMLNLFKEEYCIMHTVAKCLRVRNMIKIKSSDVETIKEESRDILGYALLLYAIQEGLIK